MKGRSGAIAFPRLGPTLAAAVVVVAAAATAAVAAGRQERRNRKRRSRESVVGRSARVPRSDKLISFDGRRHRRASMDIPRGE